MSAVRRRPMTPEEFLAGEEGQTLPWQLGSFAPMAMIGGKRGHAAIQREISIAIGARLCGTHCDAFTSEPKSGLSV